MKKAIITGITGQDSFYPTELLLDKGYDIYGVISEAVVLTQVRSITLSITKHIKVPFFQ